MANMNDAREKAADGSARGGTGNNPISRFVYDRCTAGLGQRDLCVAAELANRQLSAPRAFAMGTHG